MVHQSGRLFQWGSASFVVLAVALMASPSVLSAADHDPVPSRTPDPQVSRSPDPQISRSPDPLLLRSLGEAEPDPDPSFDPSPPPPPDITVEPSQATEESAGDYLRLLLHVNRTTGQFRVVSHSRLNDPPPQHRAPVEPGEWLVKAEDDAGEVLWERPIPDPTVVYAEAFDPHSGAISGEHFLRDEADFPLVIPAEPAVARLSFFEPRPSPQEQKPFDLVLIGIYEVPR